MLWRIWLLASLIVAVFIEVVAFLCQVYFVLQADASPFDAPSMLRSDHGFFVQGMSTVDAGELGPLGRGNNLMLS
jgi:hypothetical protein